MIIYKITNLVNGKIYVGQTVRDLDERIAEHKRHDGIVGRAIKKYGEGNFCFEVIDKANNIDELNEKEKYWIRFNDCIKPNGYNLCEGGGNTKGYRHREESKRKMSETQKARGSQKGKKNHFYGKTHSSEQKKKWSKERKGRKHSKETIQKMRLSKPNARKVINIDTGEIFPTISLAAEKYGLKSEHICRVCRGKRKRTGGYRWSYYPKAGDT